MTSVRRITTLRWRTFLSSPEGIEGVSYLRDTAPRGSGSEPHTIIFGAGKTEGYAECMDRLIGIPDIEPGKTPFDSDLENPGLEKT